MTVQRIPRFRPALLLLLILLIAACGRTEQRTPTPSSETEPPAAATSAAPTPATASSAPYVLYLQSAADPSLEPACLEPAEGLGLRAAPFPGGGVQPGVSHLFCAVAAPAGAMVRFTLLAADGSERVFERQSEAGVAALNLRLGPAAVPGDYTLRASAGDAQTELSFQVQAPGSPFIALLDDPLPDNPSLIRIGIGGLAATDSARFALYSLGPPAAAAAGAAAQVSEASVLISTNLPTDADGRADVELDVADLPAGPYLLVLLPQGLELGDPPTLRLPEQENLVVLANITRTTVAAAPETPTPSEETAPPSTAQPLVPSADMLPPAPVPAASGGGLPPSLTVNIAAASLPVCQPAAQPSLQLWPSAGQIGDWWLGCLRGFAPNESVQISVKLANGQTTTITPTTGADGAAIFRWYATPGEGVGLYSAVATAASGAQAELSWQIGENARPRVLVFPHEYFSGQPGEISLSGFPARGVVQLGLYRLEPAGQAALIKRWQLETNRWGAYNGAFNEVTDQEPGQFLIIAQGGVAGSVGGAYIFGGIDVAASAIEFFSFNAPLDPSYEVYTLYAGRGEGSLITADKPAEPAPPVESVSPAEPSPEPEPEPVPIETILIPAENITLAEDVSAPPTCPGATPGEPTFCILPTTLPRGAFVALLAHDFPPDTAINVTVSPPRGAAVPLRTTRADANGYADFYWYTLNTEPLGEYKVLMRDGGKTLNGAFTVAAPTQPLVVAQPRTAPVGTPVLVSVNGFTPNESLILTRYRRTASENGQLTLTKVDSVSLRTGGIGGGQRLFNTTGVAAGEFFLVIVQRPGQAEVLAQAVYSIAEPLYLRYPFAWGQNYQEGQ